MDLSKLSDADLMSLKSGDLSKVSDAGLMALRGQPAPSKIDPTEGMSGADKFLAGAGKAFYDVGRGAGALITDAIPAAANFGFATRKDIDEAKKLDAPLMNTGSGTAGNIVGNIAAFAPAAMLPGANTIAGGAAIGGITGALQPVGEKDSRLTNIGEGGAVGAAVPAIIRALKVGRAALIDPYTDAGKTRILGGTLNRAATDPAQAMANLRSAAGNTPGFMPTAGQAANDAGIASIERAARAIDPAGFGAVDNSQRAALVNALRGIAKTPEERRAAMDAVEKQAKQLYGDAFKESVPVTPELQKLVGRKSLQRAEQRAIDLANEMGVPFNARLKDMRPQYVPIEAPPVTPSLAIGPTPTDSLGMLKAAPEISVAPQAKPSTYFEIPPVDSVPVRDVHTLKMGMDALMADPTLGIAGREAKAINATRNKLLDLLPESYQKARLSHIEMNKPIHQMDIGKELYSRFVPALADGADVPFKSKADAFAEALRNGDDLAKNVTGLKNATMAGIMEPEQMSVLNGVKKDAQMKAAAESAGRGSGSDTVQKMAMSNLISEAGLPSWIQSMGRVPGGWMKTLGDVLYTKNDEAMRHLLADVLKDPQTAAAAMQKAGVAPSKMANYLRIGVQGPAMALPAIMNAQQ